MCKYVTELRTEAPTHRRFTHGHNFSFSLPHSSSLTHWHSVALHTDPYIDCQGLGNECEGEQRLSLHYALEETAEEEQIFVFNLTLTSDR